jgi:hypothetical protein
MRCNPIIIVAKSDDSNYTTQYAVAVCTVPICHRLQVDIDTTFCTFRMCVILNIREKGLGEIVYCGDSASTLN